MSKYFKKISWLLSVVLIGLIFGLGVGIVKAWTEPSEAPPDGNLAAPINVGLEGQVKAGGLTLATNGGIENGLLVVNGNVGIGTIDPKAKLDVNGGIRFKFRDQQMYPVPVNGSEDRYDDWKIADYGDDCNGQVATPYTCWPGDHKSCNDQFDSKNRYIECRTAIVWTSHPTLQVWTLP